MVSALRIQTHHNFELLHHNEAMDGKKTNTREKHPNDLLWHFGISGAQICVQGVHWRNEHLDTLRVLPHRYSRQAETVESQSF